MISLVLTLHSYLRTTENVNFQQIYWLSDWLIVWLGMFHVLFCIPYCIGHRAWIMFLKTTYWIPGPHQAFSVGWISGRCWSVSPRYWANMKCLVGQDMQHENRRIYCHRTVGYRIGYFGRNTIISSKLHWDMSLSIRRCKCVSRIPSGVVATLVILRSVY